MEIKFKVLDSSEKFVVEVPTPGSNKHGPGHRVVFSDNLQLESVDPPPLVGLPPNEDDRRAGTQSGLVLTLRESPANDKFLPGGSLLFQVETTYRLNAITHAGQPVLKAGQITARGVTLGQLAPGEEKAFAITGGTGPYVNARGQITETGDTRKLRLLDPPL